MLLWAKPIPKKLRLHDTRHTTATLLLVGGSDLYAVARLLRPGSQSDRTVLRIDLTASLEG